MQGFDLTRAKGARIFLSIRVNMFFQGIENRFFISGDVDPLVIRVHLFCISTRDVVISQNAGDRDSGLVICTGNSSGGSRFIVVIRNMSCEATFIIRVLLIVVFPINFMPFAFRLGTFKGRF